MSFFATLLFQDSHNAQFFCNLGTDHRYELPDGAAVAVLCSRSAGRRIFGLLFREERRQVLFGGDGVGSEG